MSKSVKMIVGVVAAVAIPFAAPALAASLMASTALPALAAGATALGTTGTSAIIGAGLGAASAAATGGDVGKGALFGGLGGGLGGLAKGLQGGQTLAQAARGVPTAAAAPGAAAGAVPQAAQSVLTPEGYAAYGAQQAATGGGVSTGFNTGSYLAGLNTGAAPGTAGQLAGLTGQVPYSPSPTAVGTPAAPQTFGERFSAGVKDAWGNMTSPENLSNVAVEGGKYLAGSLAAGSGMSSAEEAMMRAQRQEMKRAQDANDAMYNTRRDEALKLINEANYFDPEYMGLQRARDAQLQSARTKQAGLRGLTGSARQAESRRFDLGTNRATGSAYDEGYQSGVTSRTNTRVAGLSQLPTGYNMTTANYGQIASEGRSAEEQRRRRARDIGNLFGDFSGTRDAKSTGG